MIQTNPSKFDERLFSDIYLCRLRLKQRTEIHDFIFGGKEFKRERDGGWGGGGGGLRIDSNDFSFICAVFISCMGAYKRNT